MKYLLCFIANGGAFEWVMDENDRNYNFVLEKLQVFVHCAAEKNTDSRKNTELDRMKSCAEVQFLHWQ